MSTALIIRDDSRRTAMPTQAAFDARCSALELALLVFKVSNPQEQEAAVAAQAACKATADAMEKARKAAKAPIIEFGREIDAVAADYCKELMAEVMRLARLNGDYQAVLEQRRRAEEALRMKELAEIERRRQEELAKATTVEQVDAIQERINNEAKLVSEPPPPPPRAKGQIVGQEWEIEVIDIHELYRHHPNCVKLEALKGEIKALLNLGATVRGIRAKRVTTSTVRASKGALLELGTS